MKKLLLLLVFCPIFTFGQIGSLPYQLLRQSYRGDTVYTKLNGDSVNYYTDLGSFRFNKDIYVKGVKLGGGWSSEVAKYLKNYSPNDTVVSIKSTFLQPVMNIEHTTDYQSIVQNVTGSGDGYNLTKNNSGIGFNSIHFGASGQAFRAYVTGGADVFYATDGSVIKYRVNNSGAILSNTLAGTGNRSLIAQADGTIAVGSASGVIATQLKNYNANQDTVIRLPDLASGKFGIWANINNGFVNQINTNEISGVFSRISTNKGAQNVILINNENSYQNSITTNGGIQNYININNANSFQNYININYGNGIAIINSCKSTAIGVKSYAADTVTNTSGALTGTFGKTASHLDIDGFGHYRNIQTTPPTITLGSGAGTGATYTLIAGSTDKAGVISVTTGTSTTTTGDIFTITYAYPFKGIAVFMAVPANDAASSVQGQARPHMNGYSPTFSGLTASGSALTAGTTYVWHYFVAQ